MYCRFRWNKSHNSGQSCLGPFSPYCYKDESNVTKNLFVVLVLKCILLPRKCLPICFVYVCKNV